MSWLYIVRHRAERATEEARTKIVCCDGTTDWASEQWNRAFG